MSLFKYICSFLFSEKKPLLKDKHKSIKLLLIHNLCISPQDTFELKQHLISEVRNFLCDVERKSHSSTPEITPMNVMDVFATPRSTAK